MTTTISDQDRPSQWQSRPVATDPNSVDSIPSEVSSMLVHDLRNSVATVNGYAELLGRRAARGNVQPTDIAQSLRHIQDAVKTIERLLDQFSAGPETGSPGASDLIEVARHVAGQTRPEGNGPQRVNVSPATHHLKGIWDRVDLERVLANLYDNALKYSPADRQVVVTLGQAGGWAVVRVADQGSGIPSPDLHHVFDPGYRASNVAALAPGSGTGLATVQSIVQRLGGKISIQSLQEVGTTVTVRLPIRREGSSIS
jgi:signal transduction histidine kinase